MKAFELKGRSRGSIVDLEDPKLRDSKSAIVRMSALSVCGTDTEIYSGEIKTKKVPIILGHEGGGVVEEIGPSVQSLREKTKVLVDPNISDDTCDLCRRGLRNLCVNGGLMGRDEDGLFAERIVINSKRLYALPHSVDDEVVPLIQPLSTVVRGVNALEIEHDDHVIIVGLGVTGLLFAKLCKLRGANVIAARRFWAERMWPLSKRFGVDFPVNLSKQNLKEEVKKITHDKGAPKVILTAPSPGLLQTCVDMVRAGGTILQFFNLPSRSKFDTWKFYMKEVKLIATRSSNPADFATAIELARSRLVPLEELVTQRFKFEDSAVAIETSKDRRENLKVVIRI